MLYSSCFNCPQNVFYSCFFFFWKAIQPLFMYLLFVHSLVTTQGDKWGSICVHVSTILHTVHLVKWDTSLWVGLFDLLENVLTGKAYLGGWEAEGPRCAPWPAGSRSAPWPYSPSQPAASVNTGWGCLRAPGPWENTAPNRDNCQRQI